MKSLDFKVLKVFLLSLPIVILLAVLSMRIDPSRLNDGSIYDHYNTLMGVVFATWMLISLFLSLRLLFSSKFRSEALSRLSFFRERDEREVMISAKATRNSFLTTLALLIFMLGLSMMEVAVFRVPEELATNGKTGTLSLGLKVNFFLNEVKQVATPSSQDYFRYSGLPLSNFAILMVLILWQLGSYNYFMRRYEDVD